MAARDHRKIVRQEVGVGAAGIVGRDRAAAIAVVEAAETGDVFVVLHEAAVIDAARSAGPGAGFQPVAGPQPGNAVPSRPGIDIAEQRIDRETVRSVTDQRRMGLLRLPGDQRCREAVIVIGPARLDMGIGGVEAEIDGAGQRLVLPAGVRIVAPILRRAGVEGDAVQGNAERRQAERRRLGRHLRVQRHAIDMVLFRDGMRVAAVREWAGHVIRDAVAADVPVEAVDRDFDFVFRGAGRLRHSAAARRSRRRAGRDNRRQGGCNRCSPSYRFHVSAPFRCLGWRAASPVRPSFAPAKTLHGKPAEDIGCAS